MPARGGFIARGGVPVTPAMLKLILIVDDEPAIRDMVAFALRKAEFEPVHAGDAREAQSAIADKVPDLILLDWMLPGTSGLELARRWRMTARMRASSSRAEKGFTT